MKYGSITTSKPGESEPLKCGCPDDTNARIPVAGSSAKAKKQQQRNHYYFHLGLTVAALVVGALLVGVLTNKYNSGVGTREESEGVPHFLATQLADDSSESTQFRQKFCEKWDCDASVGYKRIHDICINWSNNHPIPGPAVCYDEPKCTINTAQFCRTFGVDKSPVPESAHGAASKLSETSRAFNFCRVFQVDEGEHCSVYYTWLFVCYGGSWMDDEILNNYKPACIRWFTGVDVDDITDDDGM